MPVAKRKSGSSPPAGMSTIGAAPTRFAFARRGACGTSPPVSRQRPAVSTAWATAWSNASSPCVRGRRFPRPSPRRRMPDASHRRMWEVGALRDFFPGGRVALERVGLGLLLVPHLLMEAAGDHLVGHGFGDAELGQGLHLVSHHLVARRFD